MSGPPDLTRLLQRLASGQGLASDPGAASGEGPAPGQPGDAEALLDLVHAELHAMARARMAQERPGHTLQATALVSEAWLRLRGDGGGFVNRAHFFSAAATAMRRILIEHARATGRIKRGGRARQVPLAGVDLGQEARLEDVLAVDEAIVRLEARDGDLARLVRLRFYAGLSVHETAEAMERSERSVRRDWALARAFLARELGGGPA